MEKTNLGRVLMLYKGIYDSSKTYEKLDVVRYNSKTYIARKNVSVNKAPENDSSSYWYVLSIGGGCTASLDSSGILSWS